MEVTFKNVIIGLSLLIALIILFGKTNEYFSSSGLSISNRYCQQLADVYYRPEIKSPDCRNEYRNRICGKIRRDTIDYSTGNYERLDGVML